MSSEPIFLPLADLRALKPRRREDIVGVVVHRIEVSQEDPTYGDTPAEVVRFFAAHPIGQKATGGGMPYPLLVDAAGTVTQTVPLTYTTPHARSYNATTVGVACIGDFRHQPPSEPQRQALLRVCVALLSELSRLADAVHGHDELTGGSADPDKECPGKHLPMDELRADIARLLGAASGASYELVW